MQDEIDKYANVIQGHIPTDDELEEEYEALVENALDFTHSHTNLAQHHRKHYLHTALTILLAILSLPLFLLTSIGFMGMAHSIIILFSSLLKSHEFYSFLTNGLLACLGYAGLYGCYRWITRKKI